MTEPTNLRNRGSDAGLLLLRVGAGLSLCLLFGITKWKDALRYMHTGQWSFVDFNRKVGLPLPVLVAYLQTLNESLAAFLVACGLFTRYAAACLFIGFAVATYCSLKVGEAAWLTAAYFALMFAAISLTGSGKLSIDYALKSRAAARNAHSGSS